MIDLRQFSIKCGQCGVYQTLTTFRREEEWNVYTYECEGTACDPDASRTLLEIPTDLDAFARRDPAWRGGRRHAGAEGPAGEGEGEEEEEGEAGQGK